MSKDISQMESPVTKSLEQISKEIADHLGNEDRPLTVNEHLMWLLCHAIYNEQHEKRLSIM